MTVARFGLSGLTHLLDDGLILQAGSLVYLQAKALQETIRRGAVRFLLEKDHLPKRMAEIRSESIRVMGDVEVPARFEPVPAAAPSDQASVEPPPFLVLSSSWQGEIELEWDDGEGVDEHRMMILLNYIGTTIGLGAQRAEVGGTCGRFIALPM